MKMAARRLVHGTAPVSIGRRATLACVAVTGVALVVACRSPSAIERTCSGTQAISVEDLHGASLPNKTLALTFDDGPGARTVELSSYLAAQGIHVGFFMNGKNAPKPALLAHIVADGHVVANHTQDHSSLTGRSTGTGHMSDADIVAELAQTDALIAPYVPDQRFLFRAPYGDFDAKAAAAINASPMKKYVGPVNWDIGDHMGPAQATDWDCWQAGSDGKVLTVKQCGDLYLKEIESVGHGVVLMHDPYFIDDDPEKGGTVDMIKYLVPILKAKGYAFARIDEVPAIDALLPPLTSADAGAPDGSSSGGVANPEGTGEPAANDAAGGGNPDPCPPSPHSAGVHAGNDGELRAR